LCFGRSAKNRKHDDRNKHEHSPSDREHAALILFGLWKPMKTYRQLTTSYSQTADRLTVDRAQFIRVPTLLLLVCGAAKTKSERLLIHARQFHPTPVAPARTAMPLPRWPSIGLAAPRTSLSSNPVSKSACILFAQK
jgi:hypothetical protein